MLVDQRLGVLLERAGRLPSASRTTTPAGGSGVVAVDARQAQRRVFAQPCGRRSTHHAGGPGRPRPAGSRVGIAPGKAAYSQPRPSTHGSSRRSRPRGPDRRLDLVTVSSPYRSAPFERAGALRRWMWASSKPGMTSPPRGVDDLRRPVPTSAPARPRRSARHRPRRPWRCGAPRTTPLTIARSAAMARCYAAARGHATASARAAAPRRLRGAIRHDPPEHGPSAVAGRSGDAPGLRYDHGVIELRSKDEVEAMRPAGRFVAEVVQRARGRGAARRLAARARRARARHDPRAWRRVLLHRLPPVVRRDALRQGAVHVGQRRGAPRAAVRLPAPATATTCSLDFAAAVDGWVADSARHGRRSARPRPRRPG